MPSDDPAIPRGVSRETLLEILVGWHRAGGAEEAVHTGDVADQTGDADATSRQTRFFETVGVLTAVGQRHRLTEQGVALAAALAAEEDGLARDRAYSLLIGWPPTARARDLLRGGPLAEDDLLARVATFVDADLDASRDRVGLRTLLDLWVWAGALDRTDGGRYLAGRIDDGEAGTGTGAVGEETPRVGLELSVDLDPAQVKSVVAAVRRGLADGEDARIETSLSGAGVSVVAPGDGAAGTAPPTSEAEGRDDSGETE